MGCGCKGVVWKSSRGESLPEVCRDRGGGVKGWCGKPLVVFESLPEVCRCGGSGVSLGYMCLSVVYVYVVGVWW